MHFWSLSISTHWSIKVLEVNAMDLLQRSRWKTERIKTIDFPLKESQKFRNLEIQKDRQNVKSRFRIVHLILSTLMTGPAAALPFHVFLHLTSRAGKTAQWGWGFRIVQLKMNFWKTTTTEMPVIIWLCQNESAVFELDKVGAA